MTAIDAEKQLLENTAEDLRADGYEVFLHPSAAQLPRFIKDYQPDAIAFRSDKNLVIEIKNQAKPSTKSMERLEALFSAPEAKDWDFKVIVFRPEKISPPPDPANNSEIETALAEIETLMSGLETRPALLMAWAVLEALGRAMEPRKISRPQTPRRLIEVLAGEGHVTPSEAVILRNLVDRRNSLIHGGLNVQIELKELGDFLLILKKLKESLLVPEDA